MSNLMSNFTLNSKPRVSNYRPGSTNRLSNENNEQSEIKEESNLEVKATVIAESENVEGEEAAEKDEDRERNILEVTASVIPELEGEEHEEAAEEEEDGEDEDDEDDDE